MPGGNGEVCFADVHFGQESILGTDKATLTSRVFRTYVSLWLPLLVLLTRYLLFLIFQPKSVQRAQSSSILGETEELHACELGYSLHVLP